MNLRRAIDDNGLYLGKFEKKEDAQDFIDEQVRRYVFTPNPKKMSIRRICREAQEEGVNLYASTFGNILRERGIEIRNSRPKASSTVGRTFSITKEVSEALYDYKDEKMMSPLVDLGVRIVLGLPTEDVVMFLPEEEGETTLIFHKKQKKRIQLYISGDIDQKFEQQLRQLLKRAEKKGMEEVIKYAEQNGYRYYGGSRVT